MVRSLSVPQPISLPIVESRDQELSGMYSHDPTPASTTNTITSRFRPARIFGNRNGNIKTVGAQAMREPRDAVRTRAQNASTVAAPSSHTKIFRFSRSAKYKDVGMLNARMKPRSPGLKFNPV